MYLQNKLLAIFLFMSAVWKAESLQCLSCSGALDAKECNKTVTCSEEQVCYKKRKFTDQVQFELGCVNKESCGGIDATFQNATADKETNSGHKQYCYECCSTENCNKDLCDPPDQCDDLESVDCDVLNSTISICRKTEEAKMICQKYCGLCRVDGMWSSWSEWSKCDVTCEIGTQTRTRSCTNPAPQYGGLNCSDEGVEQIPCQRHLCPVHGGWSDWASWGKCSATCGIGLQNRLRSCTHPAPDRFGYHCFGHTMEDKLCYQSHCEGKWAQWSQWGACSATCGVGMKSRNRTCSSSGQDGFISYCDGNSFEDQLCYQGLCLSKWADWSQWGACSATCGVGMQSRKRTCSSNLQDGQANSCVGNGFEDQLCYTGGHCSNDYLVGWFLKDLPALLINDDCSEILKKDDKSESGLYMVTLWKSKRTVQVYCDMDTTNGGWTVFQYRFNGHIDFYRNFSEYETGFGNLKSEFWLGLQIVQEMASQYKTELRIDLTAADGTTAYETFQNFYLDSSPNYNLHIDRGQGTAGDTSGLSYSNSKPFSTFDADRDERSGNCAEIDHGGWWYKNCVHAHLNGEYVTPGTKRSVRSEGGVIYRSFREGESLKSTKMMFRRVE